jgi:hypothetical protein
MYLLRDAVADVNDEDRGGEDAYSAFAGCPPTTLHAGGRGRSQLVTRLRVESVKLLSATLASDELRCAPGDPYRELKSQAIRTFFRSLLSRSKEVVEVAKASLQAVLEREKLPKDLLQQCVRPVLLGLSDYKCAARRSASAIAHDPRLDRAAGS